MNVYCYYCGMLTEKYVYTKFRRCCVSELHGPIVMCGLRLFIVVLQELHCLPNCVHVCMIRVRGCYHFTKVFAIMSPSFVTLHLLAS